MVKLKRENKLGLIPSADRIELTFLQNNICRQNKSHWSCQISLLVSMNLNCLTSAVVGVTAHSSERIRIWELNFLYFSMT